MRNLVLAILVIALTWYVFFRELPDYSTPGATAPEAPAQQNLSDNVSFERGDYRVTSLANFDIEARVLSRRNYRFGRESDLSPLDLALGWGRMSDPFVLRDINVSQRNRWYYWRTDQLPIPRREIETSSANMHMIPATEEVERLLKAVRVGDTVRISGKLVSVEASDGWRWRSSLSREDTGNGSCELVWLEKILINP